MTINEAKTLKKGDLVRIINTHHNKVTTNDECIWVITDMADCLRFRSPIMRFELKLTKGEYKDYETNEILTKGSVITRTNRALKKQRVRI